MCQHFDKVRLNRYQNIFEMDSGTNRWRGKPVEVAFTVVSEELSPCGLGYFWQNEDCHFGMST